MEALKGDEGLLRARRLLGALREEQKGGTKADHESFVIRVTEQVLFGHPGDDAAERKAEISDKNVDSQRKEPVKDIQRKEEAGPDARSRRGGRGRQLRLE
jgi:hypothetical protein